MKTFFRNLKTFALVALAACAVSCEDPNTEEPNPNEGGTTENPEKENVVLRFNEADVFFAAGEQKTVTILENQPVENLVITAPEGWVVAQDGAALDVTAPTQESVDGGTAVANGKVTVKVETEDKIYEGSFGVYMGATVMVEVTSASFNDIQIKAVIKGVEEYRVHLGTNGLWKESFDEWQNPNPMLPTAPEFGWAGNKFDVFEGSLFEFTQDPYTNNFVVVPGTSYDLAILPVVEGKGSADYTYADVKVFALTTAEAGNGGTVAPALSLDSKSHSEVVVKVSAANAYLTYYSYYSQADYEAIGGRESVIKKDLVSNGEISTSAEFTARKDGLQQGATVYFAAISIDQNGNFGELVMEPFTTDEFLFNDMVVTLGTITCDETGKIVYVPVSTTGGEVDHYRYVYESNDSNWSIQYGGTIEKAEVKIATVPNQYYGPKFAYPEDLVDGKIVINKGPWPGSKARILVLAMDAEGVPSHAAYVEYTPYDSATIIVGANDEGYEYGMPTITYKDCFMKTFDDGSKYPFVNFNVTLAEGTEAAWICGAGEEYLIGRSAYELIKEMMDEKAPFMKAEKFTTNGVFACDALYITADGESRKAIYATWLDKNGKYHEVKLFFDPVEAAQDDLKAIK